MIPMLPTKPRTAKTGTVTIISQNLCNGSALACLTLARALKTQFEVQVMGTLFGAKPWPGLAAGDVNVEAFPGFLLPKYLDIARRMVAGIRGDVIIAHQIRFPSFGIGLLKRLASRAPCALYIDDDDLALTQPGRSMSLYRRLRTPNGDLSTRFLYRLRNRADAILCGSRYFADRFGGIVVPLGRDPSMYRPEQHDGAEVRRRFGIPSDAIVVGFLGNPRAQTGIEDLVKALEIVNDGRFLLLVAPPEELREDAARLFATTSARTMVLLGQPSDVVPGFLAASDIVVVPQRQDWMSFGQLPARLVEAMAMARPIITTRIADIPELLGDAGLYVGDRSPAEIARAILWMRSHPHEANLMAQEARRRFHEKLSISMMTKRLVPEIDRLLTAARNRRAQPG